MLRIYDFSLTAANMVHFIDLIRCFYVESLDKNA